MPALCHSDLTAEESWPVMDGAVGGSLPVDAASVMRVFLTPLYERLM